MIFPNPVKGDILYINVNGPIHSRDVEISILDGNGKVYYRDYCKMPNNQFDIPIERNLLRKGLYILKIRDNATVQTGRFIIN